MKSSKTRIGLVAVDGFAALSALLGGVMVATGWPYAFPASWLRGTPFADYTLPGLILGIVVGGSAGVATVLTIKYARAGAAASLVAGVVMMGWIVGEVAILAVYTWLQPVYLAVGLSMAVLAVRVALAARHQAAHGRLLPI